MDKILAMVNGQPGKMSTETAKLVIESDDFELLPYSLTGPEIEQGRVRIGDVEIELIHPDERAVFLENRIMVDPFISVDYTHPSAVVGNAQWYCEHGLHFVMGTSLRGNKDAVEGIVRDSEACAVVAPNMARQVVAFQAMMEYLADSSPGLYEGHSLRIRESHQVGKEGTSATASAMVECFNRLGIPFTVDEIEMVRNIEEQRAMGVPEEFLDAHGWHTYRVISPDDTIALQYTHNINGRRPYALGTLDALRYVCRRTEEGREGQGLYSMIDVNRGD
jgi:4-hydroxy-tetrahydrodipicolinate reductase